MSLETLFGNSLIRKAVFGKLQKYAKENNIRSIVIHFDENGDMKEPVFYNEDIRVMTPAEIENLIK
jgi:hypothetical protein